MFAPVVKATHLALSADEVASAAVAAVRDAVTAPTRPVYLEVATDLLAAEVPAAGSASRAAAAPQRVAARLPTSRPAIERLDAAERPLIWVGGGARDAAEAVARPRRAARRAGPHDLRRGGRAAARPPVPGRASRRTSRPPARLWDEADLVLAIGSDLDGVKTQNFAQPQPRTLIAVSLEPPVNYRVDVHARRRGRRRHRRARATRARPRRPRRAGRASDRGARRGVRRPRRHARCASSTRSASRSPPTASSSSTCASRATGSPASTRPPRRGACRSRSAGGRSASPSPPRSGAALAGDAARPSRSPATAASCSPAASSPRSPRSRSR